MSTAARSAGVWDPAALARHLRWLAAALEDVAKDPDESPVRRWWAAALWPFARELADPRALAVRRDCCARLAGVNVAARMDRELRETLRAAQVPFPRQLAGALIPFFAHRDPKRPRLRLPPDLPAGWLHRVRLRCGLIQSAAEEEDGVPRPCWESVLWVPPRSLGRREREARLRQQAKATVDAAWDAAKGANRRLDVRVEAADGRLAALGVYPEDEREASPETDSTSSRPLSRADILALDDVSLPTPAPRRDRILTQVVRGLRKQLEIWDLPTGEKGGAGYPDHADVARWWALRTFRKMTIAAILKSEERHGEFELDDRLPKALQRLRAQSDATNSP